MIIKSSCVFLFSLLFVVAIGKRTKLERLYDQITDKDVWNPKCNKRLDKFYACFDKLNVTNLLELNDDQKCKFFKCMQIVQTAKCIEIFNYYLGWLKKVSFDENSCLATTPLLSFEVTLSLAQQKCQNVLKNATDCAEQNELLEVTETEITILFRKRNSLTEDKKCKLYNCLLPLKPHCDKIFNEYLKLLPNFDVKSCYDIRQQSSSGRIVFSLFISYLLLIGQYCAIIIYNYFN